jgi:cell division protein FtsB
MGRLRREHRLAREGVTEGIALACLLLLAGVAIVGPSGVLAWGENQRLLEQRRQEVQRLTVERDELRNRVKLLDPRHADSDLAGELLRRNLNVVHPDEMVMLIK